MGARARLAPDVIGSSGVARVTTQLREHGAARMRERSGALLEEAAERGRPRSVAERLRANWRWFAQAALATAPSWALAKLLFDHPRPIFAPLGGLIGLIVTSILPANPGRTVHRAAAVLLDEIALTLEDVAVALERRDPEPAEHAWTRASEIDPDVLRDAIAAGG